MSYDQRAVLTDRIQFLRMILEDNSQRIGSFHPVHDLCHRLQRIPFIVIVQEVGDHLCIRL